MALLLKNNLVYLHIPKTGGNWLSKLLLDNGCVRKSLEHKHATYDLIAGRLRRRSLLERKLTLRGVKDLTYMVVVRNPLTWYESWFKYQCSRDFRKWGSRGNILKWHVMSPINGVVHSDFNEFVQSVHRAHPGFVTSLYASYTTGSAATILKNESIREDFSSINRKLQLGVPETSIFESAKYGESPKQEIVWDQKVFEETLRLEQSCFQAFEYDTENIVSIR